MKLKNLIGLLVSVAFIIALVFLMRDQVPAIIMALKNSDRGLIAVSVLIFLVSTLILAIRLELIFSAKDVAISLKETIQLTYVGYFFNNFLPTAVGGDIVKALCAARVTREPVKSITAIMMDRIFGLFMFILIPSASLFFLRDKINPAVPKIVYSTLGASFIFFLLLFNRNVARRFEIVEKFLNRFGFGAVIRQIYDGLHDFRNHQGIVLLAMALSILGQTVAIFVLYLLAVALGANPSTWLYFFLLVPVVHLVSMLPSLNGLGIREGAYIYFLKNYIGTERAAAIGILYLGLLMLCSLIGGIVYLLRRDYHIQWNKSGAQEGVSGPGSSS